MKKKIWVHLIFLVIPVLSIFLGACRNLIDDDTYSKEYKKAKTVVTAETLTEKLVDVCEIVYNDDNTTSLKWYRGEDGIYLFFTPDGDIPYVEPEYFTNVYFTNHINVTKEEYVYKLTLKSYPDCYLTIDFSSGEVYCSNWDIFHTCFSSGMVTCTDILCDSTFIHRFPISNIPGANASGSINLNDYNIPIKYEAGYGFIPVQTLQMLINPFWAPFMYNGKYGFVDKQGAYSDSKEYCSYAANPKTSWSEEFGEYSYNHLCLSMDMYYGRKDYLGITDFNS